MDVAIDLIKPSPYQPRLTFDVDDLKEEIQRDGLLSALVVRKRYDNYELLDGERRWRVLKELGWQMVPVDVREVDDRIARRSVYKLNKIRDNYTPQEEARFFKKLADEEMKPYQIEAELGVKHSWVQACLNIFEFPEDIQEHIFLPRGATRYLYITDIRDLEGVINRNRDEATAIAREIIEGRLTQAEKEKLIEGRAAIIDEARVKAAEDALPKIAPEIAKLETPEDLERAAEALKKEAKRKQLEALTDEDWLVLAQLKAAREEAQAAAKAQREEERNQKTAEEERRRQERAEKQVRAELKGDKGFVREALKALPQDERLEMLGLVPTLEKPKEQKGLTEQFQEVIRDASQLVNKIEKLRADPSFQELDLKPFALELSILAEAFTELTHLIGGNHD